MAHRRFFRCNSPGAIARFSRLIKASPLACHSLANWWQQHDACPDCDGSEFCRACDMALTEAFEALEDINCSGRYDAEDVLFEPWN